MPSNQIAQPTFLTGPRDNLATIDIFTGTAGGIVNSIKSLEAKYDVDLIGMLRAGAAAAKLVPVIEGIANGKLLLNPQAAIARLLTASNTLVASVGASLPALPLNAINSTFNALSSGVQAGMAAAAQVIGDVEVTVGGIVSSVTNGAIGDIQALGGMINQMAGASSFLMVDTQALGGFAAGIINQCAQYGISGAFAQITKNITDPRTLTAIINSTLPNLISASDIGGLQALANVANVVGIAAVNPRMLSSFTRGYVRIGSGSTQQATPYQDAGNWSDIQDCYDTANPNWNVASRAGDTPGDPTLDITSLQSGTDDFNSALASGVYSAPSTDTTTPFYALAPVYADTPVDTHLKDMYPNTYIDPALRGSDTVIEPTQVQNDTTSVVNAATSTTAVPQSANYQVIDGVTYQVTADGNGQAWQSNAIDFGQGVAHGDGKYNYTPVPGAATQPAPPVNDPVGDAPNPVTYKTVNGKTYQTVNNQGQSETYLVTQGSGEGWTSNGINWGQGVAHGDGKNNYTPVDPTTLQPVNN